MDTSRQYFFAYTGYFLSLWSFFGNLMSNLDSSPLAGSRWASCLVSRSSLSASHSFFGFTGQESPIRFDGTGEEEKMKSPDKKRIVIVGGVAGGASAAARARRLCEECEIIMFERGPHV